MIEFPSCKSEKKIFGAQTVCGKPLSTDQLDPLSPKPLPSISRQQYASHLSEKKWTSPSGKNAHANNNQKPTRLIFKKKKEEILESTFFLFLPAPSPKCALSNRSNNSSNGAHQSIFTRISASNHSPPQPNTTNGPPTSANCSSATTSKAAIVPTPHTSPQECNAPTPTRCKACGTIPMRFATFHTRSSAYHPLAGSIRRTSIRRRVSERSSPKGTMER